MWLVLREMRHGRIGVPPLRQPLDSWIYRAVQLTTAAAALAWCLWQRRRIDDPRRLTTLTLAMGVAWLMLFGPAVEHAGYVFLTPVLAWALLERDGFRQGRGLIVSSFVLVMALGWDAIAPIDAGPGADAASSTADRHGAVHGLADRLRPDVFTTKTQRTQKRRSRASSKTARRLVSTSADRLLHQPKAPARDSVENPRWRFGLVGGSFVPE